MSRGLFIGRFQPFHNGHLSKIESFQEEVDELLIGIGSSQYGYTKENPFTLEERIEMIENAVIGNCRIIPIPDINNFSEWVSHVEKLCKRFDVVYAGNETITKKLFESKGHKVVNWERDKNGISGTSVRKAIAKEENWKNMVPKSTSNLIDRIDGVKRIKNIFENCKYKNPILAVDGIIKYNENYVLIKRNVAPFKEMFACPGGYVEWGETLKSATIRGVKEETGLDFCIEGYLNYYDKIGKNPIEHYIIHVFYGTGDGELKVGDNTKEVIMTKTIPKTLAFNHNNFFKDYEKRIKNANR